MAELHVLSVFLGPGGGGGNPLGVFLDGAAIDPADRQAVANELGLPETVFVDDPARAVVRIYTPAQELPLAGHPLVGTAWLLRHVGDPVDVLRPPAGEVPTWSEGDETWIRGRPRWAPAFELRQLSGPSEVEAFSGAGPHELLEVWAWADEAAGIVRARVFPAAAGIAEDEATGSAALLLGAKLARPIEIHQGRGSVIRCRPGPEGTVEVGGAVALEGVRDY